MSRPKVRGHRPGGRNKQFFEGLSGLARGLDAVIENNKRPDTASSFDRMSGTAREKVLAADEKRRRKAAKRLGQ